MSARHRTLYWVLLDGGTVYEKCATLPVAFGLLAEARKVIGNGTLYRERCGHKREVFVGTRTHGSWIFDDNQPKEDRTNGAA